MQRKIDTRIENNPDFQMWKKELQPNDGSLNRISKLRRMARAVRMAYRVSKYGLIAALFMVLGFAGWKIYDFINAPFQVVDASERVVLELTEIDWTKPPVERFVQPEEVNVPAPAKELSMERQMELSQIMPELQVPVAPAIIGLEIPPPARIPYVTESQATNGRSMDLGPLLPISELMVLKDSIRVAGTVTEPRSGLINGAGNWVEDVAGRILKRQGLGSTTEGHATVEFESSIDIVERVGYKHFNLTVSSPKANQVSGIHLSEQLEPDNLTSVEFKQLACSDTDQLESLMQRVEQQIRRQAPGFAIDIVWTPYDINDLNSLNGSQLYGWCVG